MIGPVIRSQPSVARGEEPCVQFDTTVLTIHGHPAELLVDDGRKIARFRSEHGWGGGPGRAESAISLCGSRWHILASSTSWSPMALPVFNAY